LALSQCLERNLVPGPLNTYKGWQELGRYVKKGEQGITLCMPLTVKKKKTNPETKQDEEEEEHVLRWETFRSRRLQQLFPHYPQPQPLLTYFPLSYSAGNKSQLPAQAPTRPCNVNCQDRR
jgi:antirestriction protein ArdC